MRKRRLLELACIIGAVLSSAGETAGQQYPNRPIRIIAPEIGGGGDFLARLVAHGLTGRLGQQAIVDNRGIIAGELLARAAPDGHTLLSFGSNIWLLPLLRKSVPFDPVRDFSPVTLAVSAPNMVVVHASSPSKSIKELVSLARAKPGELNYSAGAPGSTPHLAGELFKVMTGINIVYVPYKGSGAALNALIAEQVQVMFPVAAAAIPHVKSGRLRALAVTSAQPSAVVPGVPTVAAAGLAGYEAVSTIGFFAPARTPDALIKLLNHEIAQVLQGAETKERLLASGAEVVASSPADFAALVKTDIEKWGKVIRASGIRAE